MIPIRNTENTESKPETTEDLCASFVNSVSQKTSFPTHREIPELAQNRPVQRHSVPVQRGGSAEPHSAAGQVEISRYTQNRPFPICDL